MIMRLALGVTLIFISVAVSQSTNELMQISEFKGTVVQFTHRPLSPQEKEIYNILLKQALDFKNFEPRNLGTRIRALEKLSKSPHIVLIEPLTELIRKLRSYQPKPWEKSIGQEEVTILTRCADPKVIDLLIEFLDHPLRGVRAESLENLQKILRLPEGYRFGQLSWVSLEDANKRKEVVKS